MLKPQDLPKKEARAQLAMAMSMYWYRLPLSVRILLLVCLMIVTFIITGAPKSHKDPG